jgi:hypothetical protein
MKIANLLWLLQVGAASGLARTALFLTSTVAATTGAKHRQHPDPSNITRARLSSFACSDFSRTCSTIIV